MKQKRINKVKEYPHLGKDAHSNAVLNTDMSALDAYKKRRNQLRKIERVTTEMEELKSDMAEIKRSLQLIVKGMNDV